VGRVAPPPPLLGGSPGAGGITGPGLGFIGPGGLGPVGPVGPEGGFAGGLGPAVGGRAGVAATGNG